MLIILLLPLLLQQLPLDLSQFPEQWDLALRDPIHAFQDWTIRNRLTHPLFVLFFDPVSDGIDLGIRYLENLLLGLPWPVICLAAFLLGQRAGGLRVALFALLSLLFMGAIGLWDESMQTLALMGVSVLISLAIGLPLGILAARSDKVEAGLRPILDTMQTMPAFVYLIPVLLFFGIARVPSVVATVIYALPPAIRLTNLGIRRVSAVAIEAARAFGSTPWQILIKVQLPLAMPALITGVNQTIMMAFGIVVIAALIGAGGLGREVMIALQRQEVGRGLIAGFAIVFMAIILDRISRGFSRQKAKYRAGQSRGFHLFPNSWDRYRLIVSLERGLQHLLAGTYGLAEISAGAIGRGIAAILTLFGGKDGQAVVAFCRYHAFWLGSLLLLLLLLLTNRFVIPFGQDFPQTWLVDIGAPLDTSVDWMRDNLYQIGDTGLGTGPLSDFLLIYILNPIRDFLQNWLDWPLVILALSLIGYGVSGWRLALFAGLGLAGLGLLGLWEDSMNTLSQVIVAVVITGLLAIPIGVLASRHNTFEAILNPILDTMQTIPFFVYLIPVIILFNVGRIPGIMASVLYALPPGIRLTNLGLRQVSAQTLEAARAFGSTPRQTLFKVQLPLAWPAIALGVNQMVMMVLAMVVVAGLVGGGGLGLLAVKGLQNPQRNLGVGIEAGIAIVLLAMVLDRITQTWAKKGRRITSDQ
jgi:glycine betaine/proline transport system permease protein